MAEQAKNISDEPSYEGGSVVPRTLEDWRQLSAHLQARRDRIRPLLEQRDIDPLDDPSFMHLLGELGMAERQVQGIEAYEAGTYIPETPEGLDC